MKRVVTRMGIHNCQAAAASLSSSAASTPVAGWSAGARLDRPALALTETRTSYDRTLPFEVPKAGDI
eukprot:scaffold2691_cov417-Prasinococcus_capsulatus_cf.AAC.29